tara:strand:- start:1234 stop:1845 length:612 start_codon:yes stop_codon:yes gene_type:complete
MKGFVIYVNTSSKSKESAKHTQSIFNDIDISLFRGVDTTNVWQTFSDSDLNILDIKHFNGGKIDAEIATFFSHYNIWLRCIELNQSILVLEHDAIIIGEIDFSILNKFEGDLLNLGEPNWGNKTWEGVGLHKRNSESNEDWLFGAHAYLLNPSGATKLVEGTKKGILPADIYIRQELIDIYDYLPHPIKQNGDFSLIQRWIDE